jgi:4-hydroxy-tetrahydrodipicolinate synthase
MMGALPSEFLRGSYTPVVTPFRNGAVDFDSFAALVERQIEQGSHGILVAGTTGEPTSLSIEERAELLRTAVTTVGGRLPVVAATGSQSIDETIELSARAERAGADALLIVTPYYSRPPQQGLVEYFVTVGRKTALPMMIYHIPGRAAVAITAATVTKILDRVPNLVGMKHAVADLDLVTELLQRCGTEFRIFCGLESLGLPMLAVGAAGVMNAVGNLMPGKVAALCEHIAAGHLVEARRLHFEIFELNQAIFLDTNPIPLKYMMARLGLLPSAEVRLPLVQLDVDHGKVLDGVLHRAGLLEQVHAEAEG